MQLHSVSFYCGNPWTNWSHMHHFDGGGDANAFTCLVLPRIFCSLNLQPPPPPHLYQLPLMFLFCCLFSLYSLTFVRDVLGYFVFVYCIVAETSSRKGECQNAASFLSESVFAPWTHAPPVVGGFQRWSRER